MTPASWFAFGWLAIGCVVSGICWHRDQEQAEEAFAMTREAPVPVRLFIALMVALALIWSITGWPLWLAKLFRPAGGAR